eukprot:COSAG05_NODE_1188_length_5580_cov_3.406495_1_plen_112_part_00
MWGGIVTNFYFYSARETNDLTVSDGASYEEKLLAVEATLGDGAEGATNRSVQLLTMGVCFGLFMLSFVLLTLCGYCCAGDQGMHKGNKVLAEVRRIPVHASTQLVESVRRN